LLLGTPLELEYLHIAVAVRALSKAEYLRITVALGGSLKTEYSTNLFLRIKLHQQIKRFNLKEENLHTKHVDGSPLRPSWQVPRSLPLKPNIAIFCVQRICDICLCATTFSGAAVALLLCMGYLRLEFVYLMALKKRPGIQQILI